MGPISRRPLKLVGSLMFAAAVVTTVSAVACAPSPRSELPAILGQYHDVLEQHYRTTEPMRVVEFLADRWRLRGGGNADYNESLDMVAEYLRDAGLERVGRIEVLEGPLTLCPLAWDPVAASVSLVEPSSELLHTYDDLPTLLGGYSGSTPPGGITASLVDVGGGVDAADYAGIDVRGKIVLGRGRMTALHGQAVEMRGALGVITDYLGRDEQRHTMNPGMVSGGRLPCEEPAAMRQRTGWGLKVTRQTTDRLRGLLEDGPVTLNVTVETRFFDSVLRELVVEIPGAVAPDERVVLVSHLDNARPGANNNSTGVATHAELAAAIASAIEGGTLEPPARTLTFLFGPEREGTSLWLDSSGADVGAVIAAINADMTGGNASTEGTYRLERAPDPAFDSPRPDAYTAPDDIHSGWPIRDLGVDGYPGHFLNQLLWTALSERARRVDWTISQHPLEGGSDHDVLLPAGITTALSWHWPDRFMGTNFDTPDKVSAQVMENVALSHGMAALLMAASAAEPAYALLAELEHAASVKLRLEAEATARLLADLERGPVEGVSEATVVERRSTEEALLTEWAQWYDEALMSVSDLSVRDDGGALQGAIDSARVRVGALHRP